MSRHRSPGHYKRQDSRAACARIDALGITHHKKPGHQHHTAQAYCSRASTLLSLIRCSGCSALICSAMGLCQSVPPWKEKVICVDAGRATRLGRAGNVVAGIKEGARCGRQYRVLRGDDARAMEVVEKRVVAAVATRPSAAGVGATKRGGAVVTPGAGAVSGGTPTRPIWQRRVLMGVRCQMPRFSGMILYDESGRPMCGGARDRARDQEKHAAAISVLRDML